MINLKKNLMKQKYLITTTSIKCWHSQDLAYYECVHNKKILIIGDDIRQATGVANILRPVSLFLSRHYDIVQMAAGLEKDKEEDISDTIQKITENDNAYFKIYGTDGD